MKPLSPPNEETLFLRPTSIHGNGDKIALPPSVLEHLSNSSMVEHPWMFRIGIPNPDYVFPSSPLLQKLSEQLQQLEEEDAMIDNDKHDMEDETTDLQIRNAYLDELRCKYLAFTHGTVVEFTQEEGFVGLPGSIASFLIEHNNNKETAQTFRTRDPSGGENGSEMNNDPNVDEEKTPGHLAWGAFDLPDSVIEISLIQLPKGETATLMPSKESILAGFYGLKDIKLVLEQSLIRTRATLTVNDRIATWHRGKRFDLSVTSVKPASYIGVSCINTDIEITFDVPPEDHAPPAQYEAESYAATDTITGHTLKEATAGQRPNETAQATTATLKLPDEAPADAPSDDVAHIQLRNPEGISLLWRFWKSKATIQDLFDVAQTIEASASFRLVTRFPRRVWTIDQASCSFDSEKIGPGKELFLIERI